MKENKTSTQIELDINTDRVVGVALYVRSLQIIEKTAHRYASKQCNPDIDYEGFLDVVHISMSALQAIHQAQGLATKEKKIRSDWGEEINTYMSLYDNLKPLFASEKKRIVQTAVRHPLQTTLSTAYAATSIFSSTKYPASEKKHVLHLAGYSEGEISLIVKKMGASLAWTTATSTAIGLLLPYFMYEANVQALVRSDIFDLKTLLTIILSYAIHYGSLAGFTHENLKLLRNPHVGNSPTIFSTAPYYFMKMLMPENKTMQDLTTHATMMAPVIVQEMGLIPALFTGNIGINAVLGRNIAGTVFMGAQLLGVSAYHAWIRQKQKYQPVDPV